MALPYHNEIAFIACALLGGVMHYTKKFLRKETNASFAQWFGPQNWVATFYTFVMFVFVIIGALAGGIINSQTEFWAVLYTGFMTGFAIDAGFNSDKDITEQLLEVRGNSQELFDENTNRSYRRRTSYYDYGTEEEDISSPNPQLDDPRVPLAEPQKRSRRKPVAGSPNVPPKLINF